MNSLGNSHGVDDWPEPDFAVLRRDRPAPPQLPLDLFGPAWSEWIAIAAEAAACPPDYVAAPLLASASALIGHARWAQATPGWAEPPHLWIGAVGVSGSGKSPGADCLMRDVLPEIERQMLGDFPERLYEWRFRTECARAARQTWHRELRAATRAGAAEPPPPDPFLSPEPQPPRLRQHDVTIEKVAELLGAAAPKGLLIVRDELAGWVAGMNAYNTAGRAFWIEAYGGRPYRVERKSEPAPIIVLRMAVAVYGGTQPDRLARLTRDGDDGLLARILWVWPEPKPFRLGHRAPGVAWAITALERLRELDLQPGDPAIPIMVPLTANGREQIEAFARDMQHRQHEAGPLLSGAFGKARGQALRLALVLEMLWWCGESGSTAPPPIISTQAFQAAAQLIDQYFLPMAASVYTEHLATCEERNAAMLARWILETQAREVYVRHVQRIIRLPGLRDARRIHEAAAVLMQAGWLKAPAANNQFGPRIRLAYRVNRRLWE